MNVFIPLYRTFKNDGYSLCTTESNTIYVQRNNNVIKLNHHNMIFFYA